MIAAVIDLGTNTSNLVVAEVNGKALQILFQGKEYVRIGDSRIKENMISREATDRAVMAVSRQVRKARELKADEIRIIATSAVREASNRKDFTDALWQKTGIRTEVIDGDREASLIYYGVKLAMGSLGQPAAILDIGGGSNEIIVCENGTMHWRGSFPSGMSRIINSFPISNPITHSEVEVLEAYFLTAHREAINRCNQFGVSTLIGCSGAFNTLADIIDKVGPEERFRTAKEISLEEFRDVYQRVLFTTHEERTAMKGMDPVRTDLIVPALILCSTFILNSRVNRIIQTGYALREGVLWELLNS